MTLQELLKNGVQELAPHTHSATLDAELLLLHAFPDTKGRTWLIANAHESVSQDIQNKFKTYITRRKNHEPLAHITNKKEFYGLEFYVDKRVLIPRPETELIIDEVLKLLTTTNQQTTTLIDVGTGSGCIPISIIKNLPNIYNTTPNTYYAVDISTKALEVAHINAKKHNTQSQINFLRGNLLEPFTKQKIPKNIHLIITANLPYLSHDEYSKNETQLTFEPTQALDGGRHGLDVFKQLFQQLNQPPFKNHSYTLLLEHGYNQQKQLNELIAHKLPHTTITTKKDLAGHDRMITVKKRSYHGSDTNVFYYSNFSSEVLRSKK